jgi:RNA polymerase sigma-70 factor (ECF subfamily)
MILFVLLTENERETVSRMIKLVAQGDERALVTIYDIVGGRLLSVAMGVTRNLHAAEDALSESFIKVVNYASQFQGGNGYAWLCTIVRNTAINIIKKERHKQGEDIDGFFHLTDGRDFAAASDTAIEVERAMKVLDSRERLCIWLKYFNDYTVREIAAEANLGKSTVQEIIKKAEEKLKQYLK